MNRRTSLILLATVLACACLYQETNANRPLKDAFQKAINKGQTPADSEFQSDSTINSQKWNPFDPYIGEKAVPKEDHNALPGQERQFLWNPLKFVLRIIAIVTYPPRFIIRFFFTFAATFFLVLFNCQVIPEVRCAVPVAEMIPGIMDGLKQELDFYASLGKDE